MVGREELQRIKLSSGDGFILPSVFPIPENNLMMQTFVTPARQ